MRDDQGYPSLTQCAPFLDSLPLTSFEGQSLGHTALVCPIIETLKFFAEVSKIGYTEMCVMPSRNGRGQKLEGPKGGN